MSTPTKKIRTSVVHNEQSVVFVPSGKRPLCRYCGTYFDGTPEQIAAATHPEGLFCMDTHHRSYLQEVAVLPEIGRPGKLNEIRQQGMTGDLFYLPIMEKLPNAQTPQEPVAPDSEPFSGKPADSVVPAD